MRETGKYQVWLGVQWSKEHDLADHRRDALPSAWKCGKGGKQENNMFQPPFVNEFIFVF